MSTPDPCKRDPLHTQQREIVHISERVFTLQDAISDIEIGTLNDVELDTDSGAVTARWSDNNINAIILCEFERSRYNDVSTFAHIVADDASSNCGVFISTSHRVQATKQVHITRAQDKPIVIVSRSIKDDIDPTALIHYGFITLYQIMRFCEKHTGESGQAAAVNVQNWESQEGQELIQAMLDYKQRHSQHRVPDKNVFHGRFMKGLSDNVRRFIELSENTYAIAKQRIRDMQSEQNATKKRKLQDEATPVSSSQCCHDVNPSVQLPIEQDDK